MDYRTDLAMERTVRPGGMGAGVSVHTQQQAGAEVTWVRVSSEKAAERLGKAQGLYWTLTHPKLPHMLPEERMDIAREVAQMLRMMLPPQGDVLVLGLGNRRMTADALGDGWSAASSSRGTCRRNACGACAPLRRGCWASQAWRRRSWRWGLRSA